MSAPTTRVNRSTLGVLILAVGLHLVERQHDAAFGLSHTAILWIDMTLGGFMIVSALVQFALWFKERTFG